MPGIMPQALQPLKVVNRLQPSGSKGCRPITTYLLISKLPKDPKHSKDSKDFKRAKNNLLRKVTLFGTFRLTKSYIAIIVSKA